MSKHFSSGLAASINVPTTSDAAPAVIAVDFRHLPGCGVRTNMVGVSS